MRRLPDWLAFAAVCVFVFLAAYRIELPGLYYDELAFVNAALGAPDNTFIYMRLGRLPFLVFPYMGALKAWGYYPIFHLFGVSALTIRLPAILLGAVTLLIFYQFMRAKLGAVWATIALWIMAVDPASIFPSRLDWGEEAMDFIPKIRPLDSDHSSFARVGGGAVLNFAPSSTLPPRDRGSYRVTPSEVGCAPKHVIRPGGS